MSDVAIFLWGTIAFTLAVGPLAVASFLDYRGRQDAQALQDAAQSFQDEYMSKVE
jgi:hypothetical protein